MQFDTIVDNVNLLYKKLIFSAIRALDALNHDHEYTICRLSLFVRSVAVEVGKIPKTGQNLKVCLVRSTALWVPYSICAELNPEHEYVINFLIGQLSAELRPF